MTQQDIVNELNRMVIGYNINWDMIKYDADRAIMKINSHLGAEYPMISRVLLSPNHRYTIVKNGHEYPIFPERYLLTVVIPFIATEILARDEEFTTIYNKYVVDFENGLFDMFQNEYNKVPLVFRQDTDVGVFFDKDHPNHKIHQDRDKNLPKFEFNVYYHFNFPGYVTDTKFTLDTKKYPYGSFAVVKESTVESFDQGIYHYTFAGWSTEPVAATKYLEKDDAIEMVRDVHLFARWNKECMLNVTNGVVTIKDAYKTNITNLEIPLYIEGRQVATIPTDFDKGTTLKKVILPAYNLTLQSSAFTVIEELIFPKYNYLTESPRIHLKTAAIDSDMEYLYLPYSIQTLEVHSISDKVEKVASEYIDRPVLWHEEGYIGEIEWGVSNG